MPDMPNENTERWVRFWVKSVREDSTVRKLKRADRCIFYEYIALARWQHSPPRLRGCLCDPDGRAWMREERATAVGEKYATVKRAEEEMEAAGLVTFHESAAVHHSSRGRLRIVNYDRYQGGANGAETAFISEGTDEDQPSELKATAFKSEGSSQDQPSNLKASSDEETAFKSEGTTSDEPRDTTPDGNETPDETAFTSEGTAPIEVNDVNDVEERLEERLEELPLELTLMEQCMQVLEPVTGARSSSAAQQTLVACSNIPHYKEVLYEVCASLASKALAGQKAELSWLPRNVGEACRRLEKQEQASTERPRATTYPPAASDIIGPGNYPEADLTEE